MRQAMLASAAVLAACSVVCGAPQLLRTPTARPLVGANRAAADFVPMNQALAARPGLQGCFLRLGGAGEVNGECRAQGYTGWTDALGFSQTTNATWLVTQNDTKETGLDIGPLVVTKRPDGTTAQLKAACASRKQFASAQLDIITPRCTVTLFVKDCVQVASVRSVAPIGGQPAEQVTLTFALIEVDYRLREGGVFQGPVVTSSRPPEVEGVDHLDFTIPSDTQSVSPTLRGCFLYAGRTDPHKGRGYQDWSIVSSYSQPTAASWFLQPTPTSATVPSIAPLLVTMVTDAPSLGLYNCCTRGVPIDGVELDDMQKSDARGIFLGPVEVTHTRWSFHGTGQPILELAMLGQSMELCYESRDQKGVLGPRVKARWTLR